MAHHTDESDLPWIEVPGEWSFVFEAIDPDTGAAVAGVSVSNIAIYGQALDGSGLVERKVPLLTPEEVEQL